jgi:hypothetical protein
MAHVHVLHRLPGKIQRVKIQAFLETEVSSDIVLIK